MGYGYGYGPGWMMDGWGYGFFGLAHMFIWLIILVAIIVGVLWLVRSQAAPSHGYYLPPHRSTGLDVLEERYARGEINRDEYLQKKKDIGG